jgi:hypothetical protein
MTQDRFPRPALPGFLLALGLACLAAGGCSSGGGRTTTVGTVPDPDEVRPVAMLGEERFFDGRITAVVTISQGLDGLARRGGWRIFGRNRDEEPDLQDVFRKELGDLEKNDLEQTITKMQALQVGGSPLPPVGIRVLLSTPGAEPVEVEIRVINSYLGNFAVRPPKVTVTPGQRTGPEGMSSRLGVTSTEIPVELELALGDRVENRKVLVRSIALAPAPAAK